MIDALYNWRPEPGRRRLVVLRGLAGPLEPDQDRLRAGAADGRRGLPDAVGAPAAGLHAGAPGPEPRRSLRPAAADRRRSQAADQGDHPADRGLQGPVRARPRHGHHAGAGGLGGDSLRPGRGADQHQRRSAADHGHHLDRGLRRHHRRLGFQLQVRLPRRAARLGADGELRDRHGLLLPGGAHGLGQHEPDRHRAWARARATSPTWA